jgi:ABC-type dipeptide/oligopeptide/nickel transport system permease subunit
VEIGVPNASHFIFIPGVLIVGVVIGWILGSRAAQDAMASEMKKREERAGRNLKN